MKKYCIDCGFENASEDKFCRNCGKELIELKSSEKPKTEQTIKKKPESKKLDTKAEVVEPKKEPIIKEAPKYQVSEIPPKKIMPITSKASLNDMSKKILMIASIAIILSIVAIVLAVVIQPSIDIGEETVGTNEIKNNAVTSNKVLDGSLTDADIINSGISKITANSITGDMIISNAITFSHLSNDVVASITGQVNISNNSITSEKIVNKEVKTEDLDDDCITTGKIKDGDVRSIDIAADAVGSSEIAANAVGSSEIADNSITHTDIESGAVRTAELDNDAVTYDKMKIKIKYDKKDNVYNGIQIAHGLPGIPDSVVVTPIYDPSIESGNYILHANIISVDATYFTIALMYTNTTSGTISVVPNSSPWNTIDIYWIAIFTQT